MLKVFLVCSMIVFAAVSEKTFEKSLIRMIQDAGYTVEVHKIQTEDNYILKVFRLPSKVLNPKIAFLMHGIECSAAEYVIGGDANGASLAYLLANNGYDVWLGNSRGNIFSQNHQTFDKTSRAFWDFSFHEVGVYDLPAIIDYALMKANGTSLAYVGHAQGTTVFFVLLSMRPEYSSKISTAHLMAPIAFIRFPSPLVRSVSSLSGQLMDVAYQTNQYELFGLNPEIRRMAAYFCDKRSPSYSVCKNNFMVFCGYNPRQYNEDLIPKVFQFMPAASGYKQFLHYGQIITANGNFLQFDHQRDKNMKIYNQTNPPPYELSNIKTRIHFLYGVNDAIANIKDVEHLIEKLKASTIGVTKINHWNHCDFVYGRDIGKKVNEVIYNKMKSYRMVSSWEKLRN